METTIRFFVIVVICLLFAGCKDKAVEPEDMSIYNQPSMPEVTKPVDRDALNQKLVKSELYNQKRAGKTEETQILR